MSASACLIENPIDVDKIINCHQPDRERILPFPAIAVDETPKRSRYIIISDANKEKLYEKIEQKLDEGWELQGGIATSIDHNFWETYHQAMSRL